MTVVIPDGGKVLWASWAVSKDTYHELEPYSVGLFKNNYTPDDATTASLMTESTFPGYVQVDLGPTDFADAVIVAHVAVITCSAPPVFTCTGGAGQLAYGFFMLGADSGIVLAAGRFDVPLNMIGGAVIDLEPFLAKLPLCP
jgi:hypothetical protein